MTNELQLPKKAKKKKDIQSFESILKQIPLIWNDYYLQV